MSPSTEHELDRLHDRLWSDPRRCDDRTQFTECEHCGRAVRWVANLGSRLGSSLQVIARPLTTAAFFDPNVHHGLVAVFTDRTGFTIGRFTTADDVGDALLYRCHWDVCDRAALMRDRLHRERYGAWGPIEQPSTTLDALNRYARWRNERDGLG